MGIVTEATRYDACAEACSRCLRACLECYHACLGEPDVQKRTDCLAHLIECATLCQTAVALMSMDAKTAVQQCGLCAEMCEACAQHCAMFPEQHCQKCAAECEACAKACRSM